MIYLPLPFPSRYLELESPLTAFCVWQAFKGGGGHCSGIGVLFLCCFFLGGEQSGGLRLHSRHNPFAFSGCGKIAGGGALVAV